MFYSAYNENIEVTIIWSAFSLGQYDNYPSLLRHNALNNSIGNPRLPPYPHPITVYPLAQIKQPLMAGRGSSKSGSPSHTASDNWILVTACFSTPRVWVGGTPSLAVDKRGNSQYCTVLCTAVVCKFIDLQVIYIILIHCL